MLRVLFVCTENAARSQIAEALLREKGAGKFEAASAGSNPASHIHPLAIAVMKEQGIGYHEQFPKGFDAVADERWDLIITLCDRAREHCPAFRGQPVYAHWGMPDPAAVPGGEAAQKRAFLDAVMYLRQRIDYLLLVSYEGLERTARELRASAHSES
jgi:protein-tyrosine-phosphatase